MLGRRREETLSAKGFHPNSITYLLTYLLTSLESDFSSPSSSSSVMSTKTPWKSARPESRTMRRMTCASDGVGGDVVLHPAGRVQP